VIIDEPAGRYHAAATRSGDAPARTGPGVAQAVATRAHTAGPGLSTQAWRTGQRTATGAHGCEYPNWLRCARFCALQPYGRSVVVSGCRVRCVR